MNDLILIFICLFCFLIEEFFFYVLGFVTVLDSLDDDECMI